MDTPKELFHPHNDCFICKKEIIDSKDKPKIFGKFTAFNNPFNTNQS